MKRFLKDQLIQFGRVSLLAMLVCGGKVAVAGDRGGNGGDAVVCPSEVTLLDHFEMKRRGLTSDLGGPNATLREMVMTSIKRLEKYEAPRAEKVKKYALEMVEDLEKFEIDPKASMKVLSIEDLVLRDVDDSNELFLPENCEKVQLVIQKKPVLPEDKYYLIRKKYWDRMDLSQKALTVLHEAWYRNLIDSGATDSVFARYMNGLMASQEAENFEYRYYLERMAYASKISGQSGKILVSRKIGDSELFYSPTLEQLNNNRVLDFINPKGKEFVFFDNSFNFYKAEFDINGKLLTTSYFRKDEGLTLKFPKLIIFGWIDASLTRNEVTGEKTVVLKTVRFIKDGIMYAVKQYPWQDPVYVSLRLEFNALDELIKTTVVKK